MDLRRLDLNLLIILDALLEDGSITRVAERLQLSQPTVSGALGRLRTVLNDDFFVRAHGTMQPTERVAVFKQQVLFNCDSVCIVRRVFGAVIAPAKLG